MSGKRLKLLTNYKEENSNLMEKPERCHLNQVINISSTDKTIWHQVPPDVMHSY